MMKLSIIAILGLGLFSPSGPKGCHSVPVPPPPADVKTAPVLGSAVGEQQSKAAAAVKAASAANQSNPPGPAQAATAGELSVASANLPAPTAKDEAEALARVNAALSGKLADAESAWSKARTEADARAERIKQLEAQVLAEREAARVELARQLKDARDEAKRQAEAEQRRLIGWIFFGGAFLLGASAAVVLALASSVPLFGPKLAIFLGIAAACSALGGVAINELLANPWIIRVVIGLLITAVAVAIGIAISNQHHAAASDPAPSK